MLITKLRAYIYTAAYCILASKPI